MKWVKKILKWLGIVVLGILLIGNLAIVCYWTLLHLQSNSFYLFPGKCAPAHFMTMKFLKIAAFLQVQLNPGKKIFVQNWHLQGLRERGLKTLNPASFPRRLGRHCDLMKNTGKSMTDQPLPIPFPWPKPLLL